MHDLEQLIARWRADMPRAVDKDALDEIEDHLREVILQLEREGHSGIDAFAIAVKRVGDGAQLGREFEKTEPWWALTAMKWFATAAAVGMAVLFVVVGGRK